MTNEEILGQQVEALEKLLQLKEAVIQELESKVNKLELEKVQAPYNQPHYIPWVGQPHWQGGSAGSTITINTHNCPDGTPHQYPSGWGTTHHGTTHPACVKCGFMPGNFTTVATSGFSTFCNASEEGNGQANISDLRGRVAK